MKNDIEKYKKRLAKLLRLSRSSNANEAAVAIKKAQKLMERFDLSVSDAQFSEIKESQSEKVTYSSNPAKWRCYVLHIVTKAFPIDAYWDSSYSNGKCVTKPSFIGKAHYPELSSYVFDVLTRQLESDRAKYFKSLHKNYKRSNKTLLADKYAEAWALAAYSKVVAIDLASDDEKLIQLYMQNKKLEKLDRRERPLPERLSSQAINAQNQGYRAGQNATLNGGVSGQELKKLVS